MLKYIEIVDSIRKKILQDPHKYNQLPSERELACIYNVSRVTIRKALEILSQEGLIYRVQGRGTFTKQVKFSKSPIQSIGLTQLAEEIGLTAKAKLIAAKITVANYEIRQLLKIPKEEPKTCVYIVRQRSIDNEIVAVEISYYRSQFMFLLDTDLEKNSLYETINERGYNLKIDYSTIEVQVADSEISRILNVKAGEPIFVISARLVDQHGHITNIVDEYLLGKRFKFVSNS